ncbi:MAG: FAD-dependent oxidoreductase [Nanoarchaeota archaeon]|nr:FAD-dependent oxidoreductase [Nanoarchaeota archaeon]
MKKEAYDIIIIGAGPAGYGCAVYSTRYNLKTLIIGQSIGSQLSRTPLIQNYLGFKEISGIELLKNFKEHAESYGAVVKEEDVKRVEKEGDLFKVTTTVEYFGRTILLAMGTKRKTLGIPGEKEFNNKGISYCSTCDGPFFKNKIVGVVGGSDAAATTALLMAEYATKVYVIYRKDKLRAKPYLVDKIEKNSKIELIYNTNVTEALGSKFLEKVKLDTGKELKLNGLFIEIGSVPSIEVASKLNLKFDESKSIVVNTEQETNVKGVYAAGDVTKGAKGFRQIISAAAEGAMAAKKAYSYLRGGEDTPQWS